MKHYSGIKPVKKPKRIRCFINCKCGIILFCISIFLCCSSNPKLVSLNESNIERITIVPWLPRDILQTYYKKEISGEVYVTYQPTEEEQSTLQNHLIYYTTENPGIIVDFIAELKNKTPSIFSVFGASYGVPTFRLEAYYKSKSKQCINVVPTSEIKKIFYKNRERLKHIVLRKYQLYKKELWSALVMDLKSNQFAWHIKNIKDTCDLSEHLFSYVVLLEFTSSKTYEKTQETIDSFFVSMENEIGKREYSAERQSSGHGFPISVHLFLKSKEEVEIVKNQALLSKCKFYYKADPISVWLPVNLNPSIKNIIDMYNLQPQPRGVIEDRLPTIGRRPQQGQGGTPLT